MINLKIDNTELSVPEGSTILQAAQIAGVMIPTLCHREGVETYSSCMVCLVKDLRKNTFIPSCSALAQDGMIIEASGEEVTAMRKKAVELLLYEHRAECEAPCRIVCPEGYNIPLMNRFLVEENFEAATDLVRSETMHEEIRCIKCKGYCENACRRKKIDQAISIRNIRLFIFNNIVHERARAAVKEHFKEEDKNINNKSESHIRNRFSSRIGRIEEVELREMLKECTGDGRRLSVIKDFMSASKEAGNCMHCDCRAAEDCKLRKLAEDLAVKDPSGKLVNTPLSKKINHSSGLIFENGKCIKCGLCVRVCEDSSETPSLCFVNRGFISVITEPLTEEFENILSKQAGLCVKVCPTGALTMKK
ncbi:MAG: hypothetical protein GXY51_09120 [Bacteroidetes bacterium]|jgi:predicted molibdopterin-dependent oxidoreductase YjgC|nr:hypothetical protein [Bacteroidota bacterium]